MHWSGRCHLSMTTHPTTMATHQSFPSIEQFLTAMHDVHYLYCQDYDSKSHTPPTQLKVGAPSHVKLCGTVKLHGTHADLVYYLDDVSQSPTSIVCQSRSRVVTVDNDNCGFAAFVDALSHDTKLELLHQVLRVKSSDGNTTGPIKQVMLAGEWCGGNIQPNVALYELPKMFVIFAVAVDGVFQDMAQYMSVASEQHKVYNIYRAPVFEAELEVLNPIAALRDMQRITAEVERECPFAKTLGVSGTGEGVVWHLASMPGKSRYWFKVKGLEHTVSRVKPLKQYKDDEKRDAQDMRLFAEQAITEARLRQGLDHLREHNLDSGSLKNLGTFIKWVVEDVFKEERDEIRARQFSEAALKKELAKVPLQWFKQLQALSSSV